MSVVEKGSNMSDMLNNNFNNNASLQNGSNNLRPSKPFGLNVKVPERTIKQLGDSVKINVSQGVTNIFSYLEKNENVFDGTVSKQLNNIFAQKETTERIMANADVHASVGRKFEMDM